MAVDWPDRARRTPTVDELVSAGRYGAAVMVLKADLGRHLATPADRLRLADLLVLAGKEPEAVSVLLSVADEEKRRGCRAGAHEALRRADSLAPQSPAVREGLAALERKARPPLAARRPVPKRLREEDLPPLDHERLGFVRALASRRGATGRTALGPALFDAAPPDLLRQIANGLRVVRVREGAVVVSEGNPGDSLFLVAAGALRTLALADRARPLEIRSLEPGDSFGGPDALPGRLRAATVVATMDSVLLEVQREALERLVAARPAARPLLERAGTERPPTLAGPGHDGAAAVLRAHFGGAEWSPRVRLHVARLLLETGREEEALAVLASVAEDLAKSGQAAKGIAVLRKVERIRRRDEHAGAGAPLRRTELRAPPRETPPAGHFPGSRAAAEAALRERVGSLLREAVVLAAHAAPSPSIQEAANR